MTDKKTPTRIYAVTRRGHGNLRLVEATTHHAALRHVAKHEYTVKPADQKQIVEAIQHGVPVEVASKEVTAPLQIEVDTKAVIAEVVGEMSRATGIPREDLLDPKPLEAARSATAAGYQQV